jgi:hypothetical protein
VHATEREGRPGRTEDERSMTTRIKTKGAAARTDRTEAGVSGDVREALEDVRRALGGPSGARLGARLGVTAALRSLAAQLDRDAGSDAPRSLDATEDFASSTERCLRLLRDTMQETPPRISPTLDRGAPTGHAYPFAAQRLGTDQADTTETLEELANLGLLQRTLANRVHVCPSCEHCQINFREQCTRCASIDLSIERVLHHFRCGYTGIESEFRSGTDLACPKCRHELRQLGQDFDRPHETYVCGDCDTLFEEPRLSGQCLSCTDEFAAHEAPQRPIHAYTPTPLAVRAVELGRLTGLDVDSILFDAELRIATSDFMDFELERELVRLDRLGAPFTTATLSFECAGRVVPIFREWSASAVRDLCTQLADSLRLLDLVTRLGASSLGILMPATDAAGAEVVRERLFGLLSGLCLDDRAGNEIVPVWNVRTWSTSGVGADDVRGFLRPART